MSQRGGNTPLHLTRHHRIALLPYRVDHLLQAEHEPFDRVSNSSSRGWSRHPKPSILGFRQSVPAGNRSSDSTQKYSSGARAIAPTLPGWFLLPFLEVQHI